MAAGKNITSKKGKVKHYHSPVKLKLLGRIPKDGHFGEQNENKKMGKNIKL